jgi:ATP-dependent RNA helicase DeaD
LEEGKYERQDALIGRLLEQGYVATDIASALIHLFGDDEARPAEQAGKQRPEPVQPRDDFRSGRRDFTEHREQPERFERKPSPAGTGLKADRESGVVSHEPGMVRLTLGVGRDHGMQPGDVLGVIVGITKLPKEIVGVIRMQTKQTLVDAAEEHAELVLSKLNGIEFKGRKLWCKRAVHVKPQSG